ncbi:RNA-guided endonuclease InsQ/TnpB family protein [Halobaculum rarum]|uniref:RNA-guided endonuclease InsQ/TnpB family protein n=1 Tax=Halobaculum rarum TaxID=3075122 RepID=UPI0032AEC3A6
MVESQTLVKTLDFQIDIESDNESLLYDATHESRTAYNEAIRLAKAGIDRRKIPDRVADGVDLVKNTTQRIVAKALTAMDSFHEHDDIGLPSHTKSGPYPLRANYGEGYTLSMTDTGDVAFRISAKPYKHVTGLLDGSGAHFDILKTALTGDCWSIGTAEAMFHNGTPELHVTVTNTEQRVRDKQGSRTVVGVDVNEDNVALTAVSKNGVEDTVIIDFPEIKFERHRYFTMRKRIQKAGKWSMHDALTGREERFVRDRLHKVSRSVVEWTTRFERPCIVFEDLKEMPDRIDYGARMNRRLHRLPFRALQFYMSYKAAFENIPTVWIDPEYTSQRCSLCGHIKRANRNRKRFKCCSCGRQDHADRNASVNIALKEVKQHQSWNVPALNSLPQVRKVRRRASGAVDAPSVTHPTARGHQTDGSVGVSD